MKGAKDFRLLMKISIGVAGRGGNWGPGGSRTLKPDLELLEPMSIILLIRRTFMSLPPEVRINPGRDHGAEKSDHSSSEHMLVLPRRTHKRFLKLTAFGHPIIKNP